MPGRRQERREERQEDRQLGRPGGGGNSLPDAPENGLHW